MPLTVAVTGPTGEIGKAFIRELEKAPEVGTIRGMARRPFDPAEHGWKKTEYAQGDVLNDEDVEDFVEGADVVVHLAFIIFGSHTETREVNLTGSRNVFDATVKAGATRLVYTSSVAAYGFHDDHPQPLTEDVEPRGTASFYYSAQKAELESAMWEALAGTDVEAYVFRPCIVGGPESPALVSNLPHVQVFGALPGFVRKGLVAVPGASPVMPDFGISLQIVHADDVATALRAAVVGKGEPAIYNLAADGELTMSDIASELGWRSVRLPKPAIDATAEVLQRLPFTPARAEWIATLRTPVVMDTTMARENLGWKPLHDARDTLRETVAGAREAGLLDA